jgi:hypothetical protein
VFPEDLGDQILRHRRTPIPSLTEALTTFYTATCKPNTATPVDPLGRNFSSRRLIGRAVHP